MDKTKLLARFIDYFTSLGYEYVGFPFGHKVVAEAESGLMFVNAGIVNAKPYFQNGGRVISNQTCVRISGKHNDINEIGASASHMTSFEMIGHFDGDIDCEDDMFARCVDAIDFLIDIGLDMSKMSLTYHPDCNKSRMVVNRLLENRKISHLPDDTNIWSAGENKDSGYCIEIYYDTGFKEPLEVWNCVFAISRESGRMYLDSGAGLNRLLLASNPEKTDIYQTLPDWNDFVSIEDSFSRNTDLCKKIYDHVKTSKIMLSGGVEPGPKTHGYVLRMLMRKIIWGCWGKEQDLLSRIAFIDHVYQELTIKSRLIDYFQLEIGMCRDICLKAKARLQSISAASIDGMAQKLHSEIGIPKDICISLVREKS